MDKQDFYEDFKMIHLLKLDELVKELHIAYLTRNRIYSILLANEDAISSSNINFNIFVDIVEKGIHHAKVDVKKLNMGDPIKTKVISANIYSFFYIVNSRIPALIKQIEFVQMMATMPKLVYFKFQEVINWNISNFILKGDYYNFGKTLGTIRINKVKRNFKKLVIDWGNSNKFKANLVKRGLTPYSKNSGGSKWFLYHSDDDYCYWHWGKSGCAIKNYRYYTFRTIRTGKTGLMSWAKAKTIDQILNIQNLGNYDRMLAIININPKHKEIYANAV